MKMIRVRKEEFAMIETVVKDFRQRECKFGGKVYNHVSKNYYLVEEGIYKNLYLKHVHLYYKIVDMKTGYRIDGFGNRINDKKVKYVDISIAENYRKRN
jgi:hypothetical protein